VRHRRLTPITTDPYTQPAVAIPWPPTTEGPVRSVTPRPATREDMARSARPLAPGTVRRILLAGVGYRNLRDMSAGPELVERLRQKLDWPAGVEIEDLSFGAVHVMHWLQERPAFDAAVLVAGVARGRPPGSVTCADWTAPAISAEEVQAAIAEAVTGVISLDTLLTVLGYFAVLPPRVVTVELEPRDDDWGPEFSPVVQEALNEAVHVIEMQVEALAG